MMCLCVCKCDTYCFPPNVSHLSPISLASFASSLFFSAPRPLHHTQLRPLRPPRPLRYGTDAKIALVQRALALESGLQLYFSPWSPPAWMKTTNKIKGGELKGENRARDRGGTRTARERSDSGENRNRDRGKKKKYVLFFFVFLLLVVRSLLPSLLALLFSLLARRPNGQRRTEWQ